MERNHRSVFYSFVEETAVKLSSYIAYCCMLTTICTLSYSQCADAATLADVPDTIVRKLDSGIPQDVIVNYDDRDVENASSDMRRVKALDYDDDTILSYKSGRFKTIKDNVAAGFSSVEAETVTDYSHLPMRFLRIKSRAALDLSLIHI